MCGGGLDVFTVAVGVFSCVWLGHSAAIDRVSAAGTRSVILCHDYLELVIPQFDFYSGSFCSFLA